ncbi:MAG: hypothetical protein WDN10_01130 [bacterium]
MRLSTTATFFAVITGLAIGSVTDPVFAAGPHRFGEVTLEQVRADLDACKRDLTVRGIPDIPSKVKEYNVVLLSCWQDRAENSGYYTILDLRLPTKKP